jgi:FixJ family two-component response regulator
MPDSKQIIAIVEDDAGFNKALQRLLSTYGFATRAFFSGEDFLESAAHDLPACVILDIHLPGMSGFELFERLCATDPRPAVIFITAEEGEAERASRISGNVCLRKPLVGTELLRAVNAQFTRSAS